MGKKKLAVIDDSAPVAEEKKEKVEKKAEEAEVSVQAEENAVASETPAQDKKEGSAADGGKEKKTKKSKASQKKGKAKYRSAKYKEAAEKVEKSKRYGLTEAVDLAKSTSYTKFDGSLELHLNTNAKNVRGLVSLPFASGKKLKILAFGKRWGKKRS